MDTQLQQFLQNNPNSPCKHISDKLGLTTKQINPFLYARRDLFTRQNTNPKHPQRPYWSNKENTDVSNSRPIETPVASRPSETSARNVSRPSETSARNVSRPSETPEDSRSMATPDTSRSYETPVASRQSESHTNMVPTSYTIPIMAGIMGDIGIWVIIAILMYIANTMCGWSHPPFNNLLTI